MAESRLDVIRRTLLQGASISMAVRITGVVLSYGANVLLSRTLGLEAFGRYSIALSWALVLALPAKAGFDNSALRYASVYFDKEQFAALRGFVRFSAIAICFVSLLLMSVMVAAGSRLFSSDPMTRAWTAVLIVPLALMTFYSVVLRTAHWIVSSQVFEQIVRPAVIIAGIAGAAIAQFRLTAASAMGLTTAAAVAALGGLMVQTRRALQPAAEHFPDYSRWRQWLAVSAPLLMVGVVQELMNQIDILLLGQLSKPKQAALFAASWRIASLVPFALVALGTMAGPLIASAYERRSAVEMQKVSSIVARLGFAFSLLSAAFLYLFARPLLALFGRGFVAGEGVLAILLIGGIVNAFTGIVAYFATLTGRERQALLMFAGALILSVLLNVLLIPGFGAIGAAIASSSATIFWNLALLVYVRRTIGIDASALALAPRFIDGDARTGVA